MSTFLPHEPALAEDADARRFITALSNATVLGNALDLVTPAELDLLEALRMRMRARFRQHGFADAGAYEDATLRVVSAAQAVGQEARS